jgi:hypothetical protein
MGTITTTITIAGITTTITIAGIIVTTTTTTTTITGTCTDHIYTDRRTAQLREPSAGRQLKDDTGPAITARSTSDRTIRFIRVGLY